jgi:hypothetical protein
MTREHVAGPAAGPGRAPAAVPAPPRATAHHLLGDRSVGQLLAAERALDPGLRMSLERRFGADLGSVRIHTGPAASALAAAHRASALTIGEHMVFRGDGYAPHTVAGRWSIAHEVAHVVQQRGGGPSTDERGLESDAEAAARAFVADPNSAIRVRAGSPVRVSRQAEEAELEDALDGVADIVVGALFRQIPGLGVGPMSGLLAAAVRGFVVELVSQVSGANRVKLMLELRTLDPINFYGGYVAGLVAGLASPLTDLVGLVGLVRYLPELGKILERGHAERGAILKEIEDIGADMLKWLAELGKHIAELDAAAISTMLMEFDKRARKGAASAGRATARELVKSLTGGGDAAKESWASGLFVGNKSRERGYNIGHLVGAVISNLLIFVFTDGVGDAIIQIAGKLGQLGGLIGKTAKLVEAIGELVLMVERAIGAVLGTLLKPFNKLVQPLVKQLGRLRALLRRLLGIVEKAPEKAAVMATEAAAKKAAQKTAPKKGPPANPVVKPAGEPQPKVRVDVPPEQNPKVRIETETPVDEAVPESVAAPAPPRVASVPEPPPARPAVPKPTPANPAPPQPAPAKPAAPKPAPAETAPVKPEAPKRAPGEPAAPEPTAPEPVAAQPKAPDPAPAPADGPATPPRRRKGGRKPTSEKPQGEARPLTVDQKAAEARLTKAHEELLDRYRMEAELEAELRAGPKLPDGSPDAEKMRAIEEDLRWLRGTTTPSRTGSFRTPGAIDEARKEFNDAVRLAERARLDPKVLMRRAFDVSPQRQAVLRGARGVDQVGGLRTPASGVHPDHLVSLQRMTEMESFEKLTLAERQQLAVRQDNLIAMDARANISKGERPWSSWRQASHHYPPETVEKMIRKEAQLQAEIEKWIKDRVAGR